MNLSKTLNYSLSDLDIKKICGNTNIIPYPKLANYENIDDIFDDKGRCILLFLTVDDHTGHWIAMTKKGNRIDYFDPYGTCPDCDKEWLTKEKLVGLGEDRPLLLDLFKKSGCKVYYNIYPFQKDRAGINDCGRWCAVRLLYYKKSLKQFYDMVKKSGLDNDEFISKLSFQILKK